FFAAKPSGKTVSQTQAIEQCADTAQRRIAGCVAICVIDGFEMVEIDKQQAAGLLTVARSDELIKKSRAVQDTGETVFARMFDEQRIGFFKLALNFQSFISRNPEA